MDRKTLNEIIDNIKDIVSTYGHDRNTINVELVGEDEENRYLFRVEIRREAKETSKGKEAVEPQLVSDIIPVVFEVGPSGPAAIIDHNRIASICKKAGSKKFVIGKYSVYSLSPRRAVETIASKVKYPYETESGEILRNREEFVKYYSTIFHKLAENKNESVQITDDSLSKAIQELEKDLEKEPGLTSIVVDKIPSPYEVTASKKSVSPKDSLSESIIETFKEIYEDDIALSSVYKEASLDSDDELKKVYESYKILDKVSSAIKNTLTSWMGKLEHSINVKLAGYNPTTRDYNLEISYGNIVATATYHKEDEQEYLDTYFMDIVKEAYNVKRYKIAGYEGFATEDSLFISNLLNEVEDEEKEELKNLQASGVRPIHIIDETNPDSRVTLWEITKTDSGYILRRFENQTIRNV